MAPSTGSSKSLDDTNEGPMSLAQQWEQDKEALDRNNKEVKTPVFPWLNYVDCSWYPGHWSIVLILIWALLLNKTFYILIK